ncbi:IclR family transcriptional regulator [Cryobacterium psychrophilum]|uniref:IclR family transcriptional regulator n=1 Tax=Cryobacterium psychrophilum TaxID=41988 RepID=A0A4Y8KN88_9MICO|nr:IclR family transcriptional regulator C-terminal domain-containing protein [Cryobacterium psychrophilum]TFD79552.1 IclR family transcriptional regulator [Cryobacterium psychrophilum]
MMTASHDHTLIASVQRAVQLVDIVANAARPTPVKVLAQASGLSLGTTYNIVRTLVHEGYLSREPDGLVLGDHFPSLRSRDDEGVVLARVRGTLRRVTTELGATAYFSRFSEGEVNVIDIVDAPRNPRVELWVGIDHSAHATALGKQILTELDADGRLDYLSRHPLAQLTRHTISDLPTLLNQLERRPSSAIDTEEYAIGCTCIAVPVRAPGVVASLAVSLASDLKPVDTEPLVRRLQTFAGKLSLQLGAERFGQFTI